MPQLNPWVLTAIPLAMIIFSFLWAIFSVETVLLMKTTEKFRYRLTSIFKVGSSIPIKKTKINVFLFYTNSIINYKSYRTNYIKKICFTTALPFFAVDDKEIMKSLTKYEQNYKHSTYIFIKEDKTSEGLVKAVNDVFFKKTKIATEIENLYKGFKATSRVPENQVTRGRAAPHYWDLDVARPQNTRRTGRQLCEIRSSGKAINAKETAFLGSEQATKAVSDRYNDPLFWTFIQKQIKYIKDHPEYTKSIQDYSRFARNTIDECDRSSAVWSYLSNNLSPLINTRRMRGLFAHVFRRTVEEKQYKKAILTTKYSPYMETSYTENNPYKPSNIMSVPKEFFIAHEVIFSEKTQTSTVLKQLGQHTKITNVRETLRSVVGEWPAKKINAIITYLKVRRYRPAFDHSQGSIYEVVDWTPHKRIYFLGEQFNLSYKLLMKAAVNAGLKVEPIPVEHFTVEDHYRKMFNYLISENIWHHAPSPFIKYSGVVSDIVVPTFVSFFGGYCLL